MTHYFDDYDSTANNADDLYEDDDYEYGEEILDPDQKEWDNYYHNIADELADD